MTHVAYESTSSEIITERENHTMMQHKAVPVEHPLFRSVTRTLCPQVLHTKNVAGAGVKRLGLVLLFLVPYFYTTNDLCTIP